MKRITLILMTTLFACTPPHPEIDPANQIEQLLMNTWLPFQYNIDKKTFPVELTRGKDFITFQPNHQKMERFQGKDIKGSWEYLPHGNFIMIYGPKKKFYISARVLSVSDEWLKIETYDVRSGKMITTIYKAKKEGK